MADGDSFLMRPGLESELVGIDAAIARIESGEAEPGVAIDLGRGRIVRADGPRGLEGLLQRLRCHRALLAMMCGEAPVPEACHADMPAMSEQAKDLLDAIRRAR